MIIGYTILQALEQSVFHVILCYLDCVKSLHGLFFRLPRAKQNAHCPEETLRLPKGLKPHSNCVRIISHGRRVLCLWQTEFCSNPHLG
ncbi:hypothetical protein AVEN_104658-1 [Araneus ventricosus]|uniref:Uncharacterized protein n=1 Tax=Araneus ventricosus TaxID=182803 RepID=A0A4Y2BCH0_ARAVE|nr:hypothetical protein AVEN_104658-1 [Araneus ventricosus]